MRESSSAGLACRGPIATRDHPRTYLVVLLLGASAIGAYHNGLSGPFFFDDVGSIPQNPHIRSLWPPWRAMRTPPQQSVSGRPVVALSLALNYAASGLDVTGYHLFNLAVHLLAALLLFGIVRRTLEISAGGLAQSARPIGLAVALLWMLHPVQTESVSYIIQRTELLMGLFYLATLYFFIRSVRPGARAAIWQAVAVASCALGMASKEVMVTCPVIVLLYDRIFVGDSWRAIFRARAPLYLGLAATWGLLAWLMAQGPRSATVSLGFSDFTPWDYARAQIPVVAGYLRLTLWPAPLIVDRGDWTAARPLGGIALAGAVVVALLVLSAVGLARRPRLGFVGAWFFAILAPTSTVVPIGSEIAAERRLYLPLAAVVALFVLGGKWALDRLGARMRWSERSRVAAAVSALVVVALAYGLLTVQRNRDYRSVVAIWRDTVHEVPDNPRAQLNLGVALDRAGRSAEAFAHLSRALALRPAYAEAHNALGKLLARRGRLRAAERHLRRALALDPKLAAAKGNLANILAQRGRFGPAFALYRQAIQREPGVVEYRLNAAKALALSGRFQQALRRLGALAEEHPKNLQVWRGLIAAHLRAGQLREAVPLCRRAVGRWPRSPELHNDCGVLLAQLGEMRQAAVRFEAALRLRPDFAAARRNLAGVRARARGAASGGDKKRPGRKNP